MLLRALILVVALAITTPTATTAKAAEEDQHRNLRVWGSDDADSERSIKGENRVEYKDQPCTCQCPRGGYRGKGDDKEPKMGVLVTKLNKKGGDECIRYEAVQRRIDRKRIKCVSKEDCTSDRVQAELESPYELNLNTAEKDIGEMAIDDFVELASIAEQPVCPCICPRGKKHWGVFVQQVRKKSREPVGKPKCSRNARAGRSIEKQRSVCVELSECPTADGSGAEVIVIEEEEEEEEETTEQEEPIVVINAEDYFD